MHPKVDKTSEIAGNKMSRTMHFCKKKGWDSLLTVSDQ
ncbi:MAG: hypothetical protein RL318_1531 [Fibrobacterota bacterium]|jgi:hypothetical protein